MNEQDIFQSAMDLDCCHACLMMFVDPDKTESMLSRLESLANGTNLTEVERKLEESVLRYGKDRKIEDETREYIVRNKRVAKDTDADSTTDQEIMSVSKVPVVCPCCNGYLKCGLVRDLAIAAHQHLQDGALLGRPIVVNVVIPASMQLMRVACRAAIYYSPDRIRGDKTAPPLEELIQRLMVQELQTRWNMSASSTMGNSLYDPELNAVQVDFKLNYSCFDNDIKLACVLFPDYNPRGEMRNNVFDVRCALLADAMDLAAALKEDRQSEAKSGNECDGVQVQAQATFTHPYIASIRNRLKKNNLDPLSFPNHLLEFNITGKECDAILAGVKGSFREHGVRIVTQLRDRLVQYSRRDRWGHGVEADGGSRWERPIANFLEAGSAPSPSTMHLDSAATAAANLHMWEIACAPRPVYLIGRYRKLARDVPQSPWGYDASLGGFGSSKVGFLPVCGVAGDEDEDDAHGKSSGKRRRGGDGEEQQQEAKIDVTGTDKGEQQVRKGRNSVEELIGEAIKGPLKCSSSRLHACGREDIDVRCLGNGRPFCMEVLDVRQVPTVARLQEAVDYISSRQGMNKEGDIELSFLRQGDRATWEGMQKAAEEKDKAYCCVVWCARPLTHDDMRNLEKQCSTGSHCTRLPQQQISQDSKKGGRGQSIFVADAVDKKSEDEGLVLSILQKTPLRVLHRRSLLTRTRYISHVETALLSPHYFLLRLKTSAGTYVKEWVHGDLGRTTPSVSAILNAQTDILQLDVVWLFDDYEGGGKMASGVDRDRIASQEHEKKGRQYLTWSRLAALNVPGVKSKSASSATAVTAAQEEGEEDFNMVVSTSSSSSSPSSLHTGTRTRQLLGSLTPSSTPISLKGRRVLDDKENR